MTKDLMLSHKHQADLAAVCKISGDDYLTAIRKINFIADKYDFDNDKAISIYRRMSEQKI